MEIDDLAPKSTQQRSRIGKMPLTGFFAPETVKAWKTLALRLDTTTQALLAAALNDMFEKNGLGRPVDEAPLPRGGAAHRSVRKKSHLKKTD
jgi:hypothetical protein